MAKGASGIGGGKSASGNSASGAKVNNPEMQNIMDLLSQGQRTAAGDAINDDVETAGYFLHNDGNGNISIYGKMYNNGFNDITSDMHAFDADVMGDTIASNNNGSWDLHKFDGQVQFPASALKGRGSGIGLMNAIMIAQKPTNGTLKKVTNTPDGKYEVYEIQGVNKNAMFRFVAVET